MNKFKLSKRLLSEGYSFLFRHPVLIILLLISNLLAVAFIIPLFALIALTVTSAFGCTTCFTSLIYVLVSLIVLYLLSVVTGSWLSMSIYNALNEERKYASKAFSQIISNLAIIIKWGIYNGLVLNLFSLVTHRFAFGQIGDTITSIGWKMYTYYVLPVIIVEKKKIKEAVQRSKEIMKWVSDQSILAQFALEPFYLIALSISFIIGLFLFINGIFNLWYCLGIVLIIGLFISSLFAVSASIVNLSLYVYATTKRFPAKVKDFKIIFNRQSVPKVKDKIGEMGDSIRSDWLTILLSVIVLILSLILPFVYGLFSKGYYTITFFSLSSIYLVLFMYLFMKMEKRRNLIAKNILIFSVIMLFVLYFAFKSFFGY